MEDDHKLAQFFLSILRPIYRNFSEDRRKVWQSLPISAESKQKIRRILLRETSFIPHFPRRSRNLKNSPMLVQSTQNGSILVVTHDCHPHGAQFLTLEIARRLNFMGLKVSILALSGGRLLDDFAKIGSTLNAEESGEQKTQEFLAKLRSESAQDAITSTVVSGSILPSLKNHGFRVISLVHELPNVIRDMKQEANAEKIAIHADKVVFAAEMVCRLFCEISPVPQEKIIIQPQGLLRKNPYKYRRDEAYQIVCKKHNLPPNSQIILNVAYADLRKGPDLFVEIAAQVLKQRPNTTFIWVGHADQAAQQKVNTQIRERGLQERVLFIGFDRAPMAYYAAASVYALPSREDPFPNVVLESTEVGVPVVAFRDASGAGDFIIEQGGRLAAPMDTDDFARQICELLAEPQKMPGHVGDLQQYILDLLHHLNGMPRISVVVPNYNHEGYITERLNSITHQTFPIYEIIVLDDDSKDNSVKVVNKFFENNDVKGRVIVNQINSGSVFRQWQKGLANTEGDFIWIAESDDTADQDFIRELIPAFKDTSVVLAFTQSKQMDENGKIIATDYLEYTNDVSPRWRGRHVRDGKLEISESLAIKNIIPNVSAVLFRRTALEKAFATIGDELFDYRVAGDWLVYLHVLIQGKIYYSEKALNSHRRHARSVTGSLQMLDHLQEVVRLQKIAHSLAAPSEETMAKANAYIESLCRQFGIPRKETTDSENVTSKAI